MTEITKGPWRAVADMRSERVGDMHADDGYSEYLAGWNVESDDSEIIGVEGIIPGGNSEANARAIAQVPEMVELIKKLASGAIGCIGQQEIDEARAILRKMEGE